MTAIAPRAFTQTEEPLVGNYFVAAYPPFSAWQSEQASALDTALRRPAPLAPLGIYVHVPFCHRKCDYCYYLSFVGQPYEVVNQYLDCVARELALYACEPAVSGRQLSFVYFGGGTPSTLCPYQVRCLFLGLQSALPWDGVEEVTFECAPRSVRPELLETLMELGVTRLSMGVQSFDNELLRLNGRIHLVEDVERAYAMIQEAGFGWVNLDLMAGLMGETRENWRETIRRVIELEPESVTIYQTEMPHNTQLCQDLRAGRLPGAPVPWSEKRARVDYAFNELDCAGYTVSSAYHAVKDPQRHRFLYQDYLWHGDDMLGLGVASFGYLAGVHYQNRADLEDYKTAVEQGVRPVQRAFPLSERDQFVREFVLQLKLGEVSLRPFRDKFGMDPIREFAVPLRQLAAEGFLNSSTTEVKLTGRGLLRVDRLLSDFYDPPYREIRYT